MECERRETLGQTCVRGDLLVHSGEMHVDHLTGRDGGSVEQPLHLVERYAHQAQRLDLLEALDVGGVVETVSGRRPQRGLQQPDLVVVVKRADGHACPLRELAHLPWRCLHLSAPDVSFVATAGG